jgi:hypothetical protein
MSKIPKITLKAMKDDYEQVLPEVGLKHCSYIKGLVEAAPDSDSDVAVPHADETLIRFMCAFLEQHANDDPVEEGWEKKKPRELTEWDTANLMPIVGMPLVDLLKASNFIGCQMMLNAVATHVGQVLLTKGEQEVKNYFGVDRTWTKEEEEQVKAKFPLPFVQ